MCPVIHYKQHHVIIGHTYNPDIVKGSIHRIKQYNESTQGFLLMGLVDFPQVYTFATEQTDNAIHPNNVTYYLEAMKHSQCSQPSRWI